MLQLCLHYICVSHRCQFPGMGGPRHQTAMQ